MSITEARQVGNALLGFPFKFEVNGYPAFNVQKCKLPADEFEAVEFGGAGQTIPIKQAGGGKVGEISLECICSAHDGSRSYWYNWRELVRTRDTRAYYRDATCIMLGPNDEPNMIWDIEDCWPKKVEVEEMNADEKKKLLLIKVTLECNDCKLRIR